MMNETTHEILNDLTKLVEAAGREGCIGSLYQELNQLDMNPMTFYLHSNQEFTEEDKKKLMLLKIKYGVL